MNLPTETGTYIAAPAEWGVNESGDNKTPTFVCRFNISQFFTGGEWHDVSPEQYEITGYFYVFKKDGQPNNFTIKALKESLGWDGRSIAGLVDTDWSQTEVQIVIGREEYNGKTKIKVQFINPRDSVPGGGAVEKAAPEVIQSLDAKYGPLLRALNGTATATKPAPAKVPGQVVKPVAVAEDARKEAWGTFLVKWNEHLNEHPEDAAKKNEKWKECVSEEFGEKDQKTITGVEWKNFNAKMKDQFSIAGGWIPF